MILDGPHQPPASGGPARQCVILLHGYGADGNDLIGLAPFFAQALPDAAFYAPNAPEPCELAPFGRQWFSLSTYDPDAMRRDPQTMAPAYADMIEGARIAAPALAATIAEVKAREQLENHEIALVGFSQGTMMALHVALRTEPAVAAVVGYSGALVGAEAIADEVIARPPVLLVHGEEDPVVPFQAMAMTERGLGAVGVSVTTHARPGLQHGIDEMGITYGMEFLRQAFLLDV